MATIPVRKPFEALMPRGNTVSPELTDLQIARRSRVATAMAGIVREFVSTVENNGFTDVPPSERDTRISFAVVDNDKYSVASGWSPAKVYVYSSTNPFREHNPEVSDAAERFIEDTITISQSVKDTLDPALTYLDGNRSKGGRRMTVITRAIVDADPGLGRWVQALPNAAAIRPVANPDHEHPMLELVETADIVEHQNTPLMLALFGGSRDGQAVREREAWERLQVKGLDFSAIVRHGLMKITSLGVGTGEPAIEAGLAGLNEIAETQGIDAPLLHVDGFDLDPSSLKVAHYLAEQRNTDGKRVEFTGHEANLLDRDTLANAISGTAADVYEAIGLAEYIPSELSKNEQEQQQRRKMERAGMISAEEFFKTVYANMPEGSVLLTGNMRNDSPQADFVINGLGWKGIIQRSTQEFLGILEKAGIPQENVELYVPDEKQSGRVFNLVRIRKVVMH